MNDAGSTVKSRISLATTACEEFWDTSRHILFLGQWCLLHERRSFWQEIGGELLTSPYADNQNAGHDCYRHVNSIYEKILPVLGKRLNEIHAVNHGQRYWRIVLGPWLQFYLSVIYDKYIHLKHALELAPDLTTTVLAEQSFVVPNDTLDFANFLHDDTSNLQMYTRILTALGRNFPSREVVRADINTGLNVNTQSWKQRVLSCFARVFIGMHARADRSIFLRSSYFSKFFELQFIFKTRARVLPLREPMHRHSTSFFDSRMRESLHALDFGGGEFEQCLSRILPSDMPKCFLELFKPISLEAQHRYPIKPHAILSANAWYFDETFKQWAAASTESGTLLMGTPHGGNYGGLLDTLSEDHETAISDRYYSWGWSRTDCAAKVIALPASKLAGRKKIGADNMKTGILWGGTVTSRYLLQFPGLPFQFFEYMAWQKRFAQKLLPEVFSMTRLRPHREDGGWAVIPRIHEAFPDLKIETWDTPFQKSMDSCRLYVCDHFSTTFAEALAANKPTILFWEPKANALRSEAQPFYDLLRGQGILFDTPEAAGEAVNKIYDDVEAWWNEPARQQAVTEFCHQFARNSSDAIDLWGAEFATVAALPRSTLHSAE